MLAMKEACERCSESLPAHLPGAFICSFECTFCSPCAEQMDERCPNCGGELTDRPSRTKAAQARLAKN
jgi:hypothetical protein